MLFHSLRMKGGGGRGKGEGGKGGGSWLMTSVCDFLCHMATVSMMSLVQPVGHKMVEH